VGALRDLLEDPAVVGGIALIGRPEDLAASWLPVPAASAYMAVANAGGTDLLEESMGDANRPHIMQEVARRVALHGNASTARRAGPWVVRGGAEIGSGAGLLVAAHERCWLDRAMQAQKHGIATNANRMEYWSTLGLLETWFHRGERTQRRPRLLVHAESIPSSSRTSFIA